MSAINERIGRLIKLRDMSIQAEKDNNLTERGKGYLDALIDCVDILETGSPQYKIKRY